MIFVLFGRYVSFTLQEVEILTSYHRNVFPEPAAELSSIDFKQDGTKWYSPFPCSHKKPPLFSHFSKFGFWINQIPVSSVILSWAATKFTEGSGALIQFLIFSRSEVKILFYEWLKFMLLFTLRLRRMILITSCNIHCAVNKGITLTMIECPDWFLTLVDANPQG